MFIRQTKTRNMASGEAYTTYRLVRSERVGGKVRQITLLNLGRTFEVASGDWPTLCQRIEEIIGGQVAIFASTVSSTIEKLAQRYAAQLMVRTSKIPDDNTKLPVKAEADFLEVDVTASEFLHSRSVGVEHVGLYAMSQFGFIDKLKELGINGKLRSGIIGSIIGRMAKPASENATHRWLQKQSGLGELLDVDYEGMPLMRLYRASDALMRHKEAIEKHLFWKASELFGINETVTLYDLTNTYFEGEAKTNPKARRGRSKEKRSDCPLVTLGLVLDGSGFVRRSRTFEGNANESKTLENMLTELGASPGAMVVMDSGIATEDNLVWLMSRKYRYLVVGRNKTRQFDEEHSVTIENAAGESIRLQRELSKEGAEVLLHCHSSGREQKEIAMVQLFCSRYEAGLQKLADGLRKPQGEKRVEKLMERIGRLKQRSRGVSQHYRVELVSDGKIASALTWEKHPVDGTMATHPGVYCLRTNETAWSEEKLWRTYTMLTDLESVFRSLKSELGLRPVFHYKEHRTDGHLFITVLAYQFVQLLRTKLKTAGVNATWACLRETLCVQRRVTVSFKQRDGRTLNVRKSTLPEPDLKTIYAALELDLTPGGTKKMLG
jgi:transposase